MPTAICCLQSRLNMRCTRGSGNTHACAVCTPRCCCPYQAFLDNYSKYPMFSTSDGRKSQEQLDEFDDARQARSC